MRRDCSFQRLDLGGWQQPTMLNTGLVPVHCPECPRVEGGQRKSLYKVDARRYFIPCGYTWRATGELRDLHLIADRWFKFLVASPVDVSPYRDWPGEVLLLEEQCH